MTRRLVIRWRHNKPMMNVYVVVELDGVVLFTEPSPWEAQFKRKVRTLRKALGVKRVAVLDKWKVKK